MSNRAILSALLVAVALTACNSGSPKGGGSTPAPPPPPPAPSGLSYPAAPAFTMNTAITSLTPTVTGSPTSYLVSPMLPAGLAISSTTGVISGTPTAPTASASYTVTASNAGGNTTASVTLSVKDVPPNITYPKTSYAWATGLAVAGVTAQSTGGAVVTWSIDLALPAGLQFSTTTGAITGTPTAVAATSNYVVTAMNSGGTDTFDLSLGVISGELIDLGHADPVMELRYAGSRVASADAQDHAILWNSVTGEKILKADRHCVGQVNFCRTFTALAGGVAVFRDEDSMQVRSANDGSLISDIPLPSTPGVYYWTLASDGSYLVAWSDVNLKIWSTSGTQLASRAGDYTSSSIFAAAGEVRVAKGPQGANVIERISVPTGTTTLSTFSGAFSQWFGDGQRFAAWVGSTAIIYAPDGTQVDISALPETGNLGGYGNWFWVHVDFPTVLKLYRVGASASPAATFTVPVETEERASGGLITVINKYGLYPLSVIDISGAVPTKVDYSQAVASRTSAFAATSSSQWIFGTWSGAVLGTLDNTPPTTYSFGQVADIAATPDRVAVSTGSGRLLVFDAHSMALDSNLALDPSRLKISSDGSKLAALTNVGSFAGRVDRSLRVLSLPTGSVITESTYPFNVNGPTAIDLTFNQPGTLLGQVVETTSTPAMYSRAVTNLSGGPVWSDTFSGRPDNLSSPDYDQVRLRLAPTASRVAVSTGTTWKTLGTNFYENGSLHAAVLGWPVDWIDDSRMLVNVYDFDGSRGVFMHSWIVNADGTVLSTPPPEVPEMTRLQALSGNTIYSPYHNEIFDLVTGAVVWSSPTPADLTGVGAVAGETVIFASGHVIRSEPR